jgi:hypothetical protein
MKKSLILPFLMLTLFATAQNFGKYYPYWEEAGGDAVIAYDDGYAILGFASKGFNDNFLFIIRTDLNGDTLWTKEMDIEGQYLNGYTQDSDGNIYLAPQGADSADLIKLSADFEVVWMRKYDPKIVIKQIIISKDDNLLLTGVNALNEHRLYKADKAGNRLWQSVALPHYSPQLGLAYIPAILEMDNNEIVLVSVLSTMIEPHACEIYHFSQNGDTISSTNFEWVFSDVYIHGNELIGLAHYEPNMADWEDNLLVRFQPDGTILSSRSLNFGSKTISLYKFVQNPSGELIAAGAAYSESGQDNHVILHGMSANGDSLWSSLSMPSYEIFPYDIVLCMDGGYVTTGYSKDLSSKNVPFLLKTDARGTLSINEPMERRAISVFPNPAREEVTFKIQNIKSGIITITDIFGRTIDEVVITGEKTIWDASTVAPGAYFYHFGDGKQVSSGKILIVM